MKKVVNFIAVIVVTMVLSASFVYSQSTITPATPGKCAESFEKCDKAHPDSWRAFNRCMHIEANC